MLFRVLRENWAARSIEIDVGSNNSSSFLLALSLIGGLDLTPSVHVDGSLDPGVPGALEAGRSAAFRKQT